MLSRRKNSLRIGVGLLGLALLMPMATPASAAGLFERLFGGFRRQVAPPPSAQPFTDPFTSLARALNPPPQASPRGDAGPTRGFCVRSCDGHYFPVQAQANMNAADTCRALCPAAETRVYGGSNIDYAVTRDGNRYANLDTAYVFRERVVDKCTCNGKTPFGLAQLDATNDPTLRPGDIVVANTGLVAYSGRGRGDFTPVQSYAGFGKSTREQLSTIRIRSEPPAAETTSAIAPKPAQAAENSPGERAVP
jgi:hypothetical protein